jgi:hypothetical protein
MRTSTEARMPLIGCALLLSVALDSIATAQESDTAKVAQNPVASVISIPFQNNANLNVGPENDTQNVLNIQPVIPLSLNDNWNLITRTILPVISTPTGVPGEGRVDGIGDLLFSAFVSPAHPGNWIWGVGPIFQAPTHNDDALGSDNWGAGITGVVLHIEKGSPWVYGVLLNNVWSLRTRSGTHDYDHGLIQPFVNYNMRNGWYVVSSPVLTFDRTAQSSERWTVPIGGGIGKIVHWQKRPVNLQAQAFRNVTSPTNGPEWQVRAQLQLLLPK